LRSAFFKLGLQWVEPETFAFTARALRGHGAVGFKQIEVRRETFFRAGAFHDVPR
jgi:hypothetical protein